MSGVISPPVCFRGVHKHNFTTGERPLQNYDEKLQVVKPWWQSRQL